MEAGHARGAGSKRPSPQNDISRSCGPQNRCSGRCRIPEESEVRRARRRDDYYFFFAVLRTERLRAGAAFLVAFFARFLVDFFFIAITGLLSLWSYAAAHARRHGFSTTPRRLINLYHGARIPTGRWTSPRALRRRWSPQHNRCAHRTLPVVSGLQPDDRLIMSARLGGATARHRGGLHENSRPATAIGRWPRRSRPISTCR